jgi:hypothetical protein
MARSFNGTTDKIVLSPGACKTLNGDITIAALFKPEAFPTAGNRMAIWTADEAATNDAGYLLRYDENGYPVLGTQANNVAITAAGHSTVGAWSLMVVTKATGANAPKCYRYDFSTGLWTEGTGGSTLANPSGTATQLGLGCKVVTGISFMQGALSVVGVWGSVLSKAQAELLITEGDSWLKRWEELTPTGLWALNQGEVSEAVKDKTPGKADQSSISGTTVAGGEPANYTDSPNLDAYDTLIEAEGTLRDYYRGAAIGAWPGGTIPDAKTAGNVLTLKGAGTLDQAELLPAMSTGRSLKFAGAGTAIKTAASGMPTIAEGMSLEVWLKPEAFEAGKELVVLANDRLLITLFGETLFANIREGGSAFATAGFSLTVGTVYHVVATWNGGSEFKLYVNGALVGIGTVTTIPTNKPTFLTLGSDNEEARRLKGSVERAAQYSGALSAAKVEEHFNTGSGTAAPPTTQAGAYSSYDDAILLEPNVISYLPLDAHTGFEMLDRLGVNNLTLKGIFTADKAAIQPRLSTGKALGVNGGRAVRGSGVSLPAPSEGMSLEVWVKPASLSGIQVLWACDRMKLYMEGSKVFFQVRTTGGNYMTGSVELQSGQVYHLVGTWDGAAHAALYVNIVKKEATVASPTATANTFLSLGAWWDGTSPAVADLQAAAIYRGVLPVERVQAHYELGRAVRTVAAPTSRLPVRVNRRASRVDRRLPALPSGAGYRGFSSASLPDGLWTPFAPRTTPTSGGSAFNRGTAAASEHPESPAMVKNLIAKWGTPKPIIVGKYNMWLADFSHPIYYAEPTDQLFSIEVTGSWFEYGSFQATKTPSLKIPIPANAIPAVGSDGHLGVILPDGTKVDCWQAVINRATGKVTATNASLNRIDGLGNDGFATAAHFDLAAGEMRHEELLNGLINHALFCVISGLGKNWPGFGFGVKEGAKSDYVSPAGAGDAIVEAAYQKIPFPPMGCWLRLAMTDDEIDGLNIPAYRKTIWKAWANEGALVGDTGGAGFEVHFGSGTPYVALGAVDPYVLLAQREGINPNSDGTYSFDIASGLATGEWESRLQVLVPA